MPRTTTRETQYILDHEKRRALVVILTVSPPVAHNVPPVTFSFYIRSEEPYFTSKAHFAVTEKFCATLAKYVDDSGFFERTVARVVRFNVFDARDPPRLGPWHLALMEEQAMRHNQDLRVHRFGRHRMFLTKEYIEQSAPMIEDPDRRKTFMSLVNDPHNLDVARLMNESIKFNANYRKDTQEDEKDEGIQLLTDEANWPHPARGASWVEATEPTPYSKIPLSIRERLPQSVVQVSQLKLQYDNERRNPHPRGSILHPESTPPDLILPHESSLGDYNPFRLVIFFIDPENDDPTGNSLNGKGLKTCFFGSSKRKHKFENITWDKDGKEPQLRDLMLEILPTELRKEPDMEEAMSTTRDSVGDIGLAIRTKSTVKTAPAMKESHDMEMDCD